MTKTTTPEYDAFCKLLSGKVADLSPQLQKIAHFIMENPHEAALETATEIAARLNVQPSTLIRLSQILGFPGFSDIQKIFRQHTRLKLTGSTIAYTDRIRSLREQQKNKRNAAKDLLDQFIYANIASLEQLQHDINASKFNRAIKLIEKARCIFILGTRRSFPAASYMFYTFARLHQRSYLLDAVGGLLKQQAESIQKHDALMIFTFPPYAKETLEITREAKDKGAKIVSVTDSPIAPVVELSDYNFSCDKVTVSGFRTVAASLCIAQAMAVELGVDMIELD